MLSTTTLTTVAVFALDHPVESITYDRHHQRLIVASQFGLIKAYTISSTSEYLLVPLHRLVSLNVQKGAMQLLWQGPSLNFMPKDLRLFGDDKIAAFLLQSGEM